MLYIVLAVSISASEFDRGDFWLRDKILDPFAALDKIISNAALDDLQCLNAYKHAEYRHCRIAREHKGKRDAQHPEIHTVKHEGDDRFAAGAEREVAGIRESVHRHHHGAHQQQLRRELLYMIGGIVNLRDQRSEQRHYNADYGAQRDRESDELSVLIDGLLKLTRAEELADDDGDGIAQ